MSDPQKNTTPSVVCLFIIQRGQDTAVLYCTDIVDITYKIKGKGKVKAKIKIRAGTKFSTGSL